MISQKISLSVNAIKCDLQLVRLIKNKKNPPKQPIHVIITNIFFFSGIDVAFKTMSASFVNLDIPHAYALLFYLAIFLAGLMFLVSSYSLISFL